MKWKMCLAACFSQSLRSCPSRRSRYKRKKIREKRDGSRKTHVAWKIHVGEHVNGPGKILFRIMNATGWRRRWGTHTSNVHVFEVDFGAAGLRQPLFAAGENCPRSISLATSPMGAGGSGLKYGDTKVTIGQKEPLAPPSPGFSDFADVVEGGSPTRNFRQAGLPERWWTHHQLLQDALREKSPARNKRIAEDLGSCAWPK